MQHWHQQAVERLFQMEGWGAFEVEIVDYH
jgi:hypothetical protein